MTDKPATSNTLAEQRTDMALDRTMMALDRTLMAWIRTSLSLIGFGFTIFKFLQSIRETSVAGMRENAPRNLGLFLIFLGMGVLGMAMLQYRASRTAIVRDSATKPPLSIAMIGAAGVLIVGLFTILNILFGLGGF